MSKHTILLITLLLFAPISLIANDSPQQFLRDSIPPTWRYESSFSQTLPTDDRWWNNFNDTCLDSLMNIAIANNYDLLIAQKRIVLAKAALRIAQSNFFPSATLGFGWNKIRTPGNITSEDSPSTNSDYFDLGLNFNWEIDVFGHINYQSKSKKALWQATKSQYYGAMVTLCSNVATAYINLRTWQMEFIVATTHLKSQKAVLEMTETRFKSGLASMLDVSQAKMVYLSTLASIAPLKASIETQINSIAILLGVYSNQLPAGVIDMRALPSVPTIIPVGLPIDLLRRRPDIKEAEYTIASYAAELGVAKKDFLPTLNLSGQIGFKSHKIDKLFKDNSFGYSISPTLSWTVFDGLNRKYQIISSKEQYMIGIDNYNNIVMTAVKETENAMITYNYMVDETMELKGVTDEAFKSLQLSIDLYKRGLSAFTNVLSSQQSYLQYNNSLVVSKGRTLLALVSIYQALGGGWENYELNNNK